MKGFTITVIGLLALTALSIYCTTQEEGNYYQRLNGIARKVNAMGTTWTAEAHGKFESLTAENARKLCGTKFDKEFKMGPAPHSDLIQNIKLPDSFDAREAWPGCESIKEIRDQSNCGSCWAFGASETMSDRWCIASNQTDQTRISSEDLTACCFDCGWGCGGGYAGAAWNFWLSSGIVSGGLYGDQDSCLAYTLPPCAHHTDSKKYPACDQDYDTPRCTQKCGTSYMRTYFQDKTYAKSVYSVQGEKQMMAELKSFGPIDVSMTVFEDFLTYKSGIYQHVTGGDLGGHSVKLIGWGSEGGVDYWIVVNSWNETWAENGTFRIVRGANESGIEAQGYAGIPDWPRRG